MVNSISKGISDAALSGYKESFQVTSRGLYSVQRSRYYRPEQLSIVHTYRLGHPENPLEKTTVYSLEASDGLKGTLMLSDSSADNAARRFLKQVEEIQRSMQRHDRNVC
jgi:hypothetical protein